MSITKLVDQALEIGFESSVVRINNTKAVVAYNAAGNDGVISTITLLDNGDFNTSSITHDDYMSLSNSLIKLTDTRLVLAYKGGNNGANTLKLKVFDIATDGALSQTASETYNTAGHISLVKLTDNRVVVAYAGPGSDGFIQTFDIAANGAITTVTSGVGNNPREHDTSKGTHNSLIKLSDTRVALAYTGPSDKGYIKTLDINSDGTISVPTGIGNNHTKEHDNNGEHNSLIKLKDNDDGSVRVVLAYTGADNDGFIKTFDITANGSLSNALDTKEHDSNNGTYNSLIKLSDTRVVLAYTGTSNGIIKSFTIDSNGIITQETDPLTHSNDSIEFNNLIKISPTKLLLAYSTSVTGVVQTFSIPEGWCETLNIPTTTTNICFPAGSIVNTDQGKIAIEKLVPNVNTIDNKKIVTITETYMSDDTIVKIKKDAISKNVPNKDTVISGFHKVFNQGKLIEAYKLANFYKDIKYIPYKGEKLYNVLMENWEMMKVNNMTVETLHPENIIAKLHNSKLPESKKLELLGEISQAVINEDHQKFDLIKNHILN